MSAQANEIEEDEFPYYPIQSLKILYNLANFNRPKCYIPGETAVLGLTRQKFIMWGGLTCLYYISEYTKIEEIEEFCKNSMLRELDINDLESVLNGVYHYYKKTDDLTGGIPGEEIDFPE